MDGGMEDAMGIFEKLCIFACVFESSVVEVEHPIIAEKDSRNFEFQILFSLAIYR
jgi:hypothetical protein